MLIKMDGQAAGGGGKSIVKCIAYAKCGTNQTQITKSDYDSDFVSRSTDKKTITFLKDCQGVIGLTSINGSPSSFSGTITTEAITTGNYYTDSLWYFNAKAGDTVTFSATNWWGYEILTSVIE